MLAILPLTVRPLNSATIRTTINIATTVTTSGYYYTIAPTNCAATRVCVCVCVCVC